MLIVNIIIFKRIEDSNVWNLKCARLNAIMVSNYLDKYLLARCG